MDITQFDMNHDEVEIEMQYKLTTLYNLNEINNINKCIEKNKFTELMVRCRLNIFKQETHINTNLEDKNTDTDTNMDKDQKEVSKIYTALRLGSNYQRRCIDFIY